MGKGRVRSPLGRMDAADENSPYYSSTRPNMAAQHYSLADYILLFICYIVGGRAIAFARKFYLFHFRMNSLRIVYFVGISKA